MIIDTMLHDYIYLLTFLISFLQKWVESGKIWNIMYVSIHKINLMSKRQGYLKAAMLHVVTSSVLLRKHSWYSMYSDW
jgi:hypothetical protein